MFSKMKLLLLLFFILLNVRRNGVKGKPKTTRSFANSCGSLGLFHAYRFFVPSSSPICRMSSLLLRDGMFIVEKYFIVTVWLQNKSFGKLKTKLLDLFLSKLCCIFV